MKKKRKISVYNSGTQWYSIINESTNACYFPKENGLKMQAVTALNSGLFIRRIYQSSHVCQTSTCGHLMNSGRDDWLSFFFPKPGKSD